MIDTWTALLEVRLMGAEKKIKKLEKALRNIVKERDDKDMDVVSLCFEIEDARKVLNESR